MSKINKSTVHTRQKNFQPFMKCFFISVLIGILLFAVFLSLCSAIIPFLPIPLYTLQPISTVVGALSVLFASLCMVYFYKKSCLLCGLSISTVLYCLLLILAWISGTIAFTQLALIKFIIFSVSGIIGGFLGLSVFQKVHSHH